MGAFSLIVVINLLNRCMKYPDSLPSTPGNVAFDLVASDYRLHNNPHHQATTPHVVLNQGPKRVPHNSLLNPELIHMNGGNFMPPGALHQTPPHHHTVLVSQARNVNHILQQRKPHTENSTTALLTPQQSLKMNDQKPNAQLDQNCIKRSNSFMCSDEKPLSYINDKVVTPEVMKTFLQHKTFNSVSINVPHVAQKSYGSEKRFLCPPPAIVYDLTEYGKIREKPEKSNSENGETVEQNSSDAIKLLGAVFIKQLPQNTIPVQATSLCDSQTLKNLYVSDSDHVKDFKVQLKLVYNQTHDLGSYFSTDIKVISKPSKKKQTQKTNDLCIES